MDHTLTAGSAVEAGFDEAQLERIRQRAETWVDGIKTRALVLLAARNGDVVLNEAWGTRTPGRDAEAISADTLFHTGSISKVVTATAVMLLAERGFLGINRPVKEYIPELNAKSSEEIKVWHLLCHTSGYSDDICELARRAHVGTKFKNLKMPEQEATEDPITRLGLHAGNVEKLAFEPGKQMEYCNYNFELLGELVRRASGQPFKDFVEQEIFHPLGMKNSFMGISEVELGRIALRGEGDFHEVFEREWGLAPWPHFGFRSNAWDIAILAQTFLNEGSYNGFRLLSPASVHVMTTNQIPGIGTDILGHWHAEASWALGWRVQGTERWSKFDGALRPAGSFDHGGVGGCMVWVDPPRNLVGVYLSVCLDANEDSFFGGWQCDIYQDMLTAATL